MPKEYLLVSVAEIKPGDIEGYYQHEKWAINMVGTKKLVAAMRVFYPVIIQKHEANFVQKSKRAL